MKKMLLYALIASAGVSFEIGASSGPLLVAKNSVTNAGSTSTGPKILLEITAYDLTNNETKTLFSVVNFGKQSPKFSFESGYVVAPVGLNGFLSYDPSVNAVALTDSEDALFQSLGLEGKVFTVADVMNTVSKTGSIGKAATVGTLIQNLQTSATAVSWPTSFFGSVPRAAIIEIKGTAGGKYNFEFTYESPEPTIGEALAKGA